MARVIRDENTHTGWPYENGIAKNDIRLISIRNRPSHLHTESPEPRGLLAA